VAQSGHATKPYLAPAAGAGLQRVEAVGERDAPAQYVQRGHQREPALRGGRHGR
jgi:hypothetical protein